MTTALTGETLYDSHGRTIGKITDVIANPVTMESEWMTVKTGLLSGEHLVPVKAIDLRDERVAVPFDKDVVKHAPGVKEHTALTREQREALFTHYGMTPPAEEG